MDRQRYPEDAEQFLRLALREPWAQDPSRTMSTWDAEVVEQQISHITPMLQSRDAYLVRAFADAILHGDEHHRAWLIGAANRFVEGQAVHPPPGSGITRHLVATVPKTMWDDWIDEGDAAGQPETGEEWGFFVGGSPPVFEPGSRLYIVAHGRVRGYAPITRFERTERGFAIGRRGDAVACTIDGSVRGFRGWRYRWWTDADEKPFPNWRTEGVS